MFRGFRIQRKFLAADGGATAIEYAFIAAGIAMAISAALFALGVTLDDVFVTVTGIFAG